MTKLLIVTQTVDVNDPVLGFFHGWLCEFAKHVSSIEVIALTVGAHALPANVRVHSLGKETGAKHRFVYALRFLSLVSKLKQTYDGVFVHMNPEYLLLGGIWWRLSGKRVGLWYNHTVGSRALRLSAWLAHVIFHTSPYAYTTRYPQALQMPGGIDTSLFVPGSDIRRAHSIYFQGRIAPSKGVHLLLEAVRLLTRRGIPCTLTLVGPAVPAYEEELRTDFRELFDNGIVSHIGPKPYHETPALFRTHAVSVNLTARGNYDKSVLESMACGTPVIVASDAFDDIIDARLRMSDTTSETLADTLDAYFSLPGRERERLGEEARARVLEAHSLSLLARRLADVYE